MKKMMIVCALAFAACGGGSKKPDTTNTTTTTTDTNQGSATPTGEEHPCAHEIALECPEGQIDACLKTPPEGDTHKCVAK